MSDFVKPMILKWEWEEYQKDRARLDWLLELLNTNDVDIPEVHCFCATDRSTIDRLMAEEHNEI